MSWVIRGNNERGADTRTQNWPQLLVGPPTAGNFGTRYDERDANSLQGMREVLEDGSIFSIR